MPKRSKRKNRAIYPLVLVAALGLGGLIYYARNASDLIPPSHPKASHLPTAESHEAGSAQNLKIDSQGSSSGTAHIFTPKAEGGVTVYEAHESPTPPGQDPRVYAVNAFLRQNSAVPPTSSVVAIEVKNGVAELSLNSDFRTSYSDDDEETILGGIARTLGAYPGIRSFRLYKKGVPVETLGGADLSEPTPVTRSNDSKPASAPFP
jgi:hypothetical protein